MREIKFRVYNRNNKNMYYYHPLTHTELYDDGHVFSLACHSTDFDQVDYIDTWTTELSNDIVLLQFTGLYDKNGKEIYEGDIVKFHYFFGTVGEKLVFVESEHELTGVVKYGAYGWGIDKIKGEHWQGYTAYDEGEGECSFMELTQFSESAIHEESFEILGNIYENTELL